MKKYKIAATALALISAVSVFGLAACDKSSKIPNANAPTANVESHSVTGTLHDFSVKYDTPAGDFIKNGSTAYKMVVADENAEAASAFVNKQLAAFSGVRLEKTTAEAVTSNDFYVVFGDSESFTAAGFTMPDYDTLGVSGYVIKTYGKAVFIEAYSDKGYQLGAISFLRYTIGYDALSADMIIYEKTGDVMPYMDITERPDYDFRVASNLMTSEQSYSMGFTTGSLVINTGSGTVHNIGDFTTEEEKNAHPKWFSDDAPEKRQPCFTAHGDREEYEKMIETYSAALIRFMLENPLASIIRISQFDVIDGDHVTNCDCKVCSASISYYGDTISGAMLTFTNDITDRLNEYIASDEARAQGISENKEFNVVMLAYGTSVKAPVTRNSSGDIVWNEKGEGIPMNLRRFYADENGEIVAEEQTNEDGTAEKLVCHNRVSLEYAASAANYIHSFYEVENKTYSNAVKSWKGLNGKLHVWLYEINYYEYIYPYNSFETMTENFRYFKECGATYVYSEGTFENPNNSGFTKLRDYIAAKYEIDVNTDYGKLLDRWFDKYFGEAAPIMRRYFNEVVANLRYNETITGGGVHSYDIAKEEVWKQGTIENWLSLMDEAYAAIEVYKTSDAETYELLKKHILIETLFPRYVLCTTYASVYSTEQCKALRKAFYKDYNDLQNTCLREHYKASTVFNTWDLT